VTDVLTTRQRRLITYAVMMGMSLAALDSTIISTALPTISRQLDGLSLYAWVFAAYQLAATAGTPIFGRLADRYGRRRFFLFGIGAFMFGSVLCAMSPSMPALVAARAVQGVGAAALLPIAQTIIGDIYSLEQRARVQGLFAGVWGLSSIVGPLLGGAFVRLLSWHWIFWFNVPLGFAALWVVASFYRDRPGARPAGRIDVLGAVLLPAAIVLLLLGFERGSIHAPSLLAGAALLAAFVAHARRAPDPIVSLRLLSHRIVAVACGGGALVAAAMFGSLYYIPLYVQGVLGRTPTEAGLAVVPLSLGWTGAATISGRLLLRLRLRTLASAGALFLATGFVLLSTLRPETPLGVLYAYSMISGVGMGMVTSTMIVSVQSAVPYENRGSATSLVLFSRNVGSTAGVTLLGGLLLSTLGDRLRAISGLGAYTAATLLEPRNHTTLPPGVLGALRAALASSLTAVFLASCVIAVLAFLATRRLPDGLAKQWSAPTAEGGS
jgi:EmrB/QacA subfamily drug resistance transporter